MKIELQNIGGITKEKVELKEGINAVTAPNAIGKTSFVTGLKVAVLSEKDIKDNTRFLNDYASSGFVEIDGKNRTIRRHGNELGVVGKPVFNINSKSKLVFAEPENEFLDDVIKGRDIGDFIEGFLIKTQDNVGVNKSMLYSIETFEGIKSVWGSTILDERMSLITVGARVRITFKGLGEKKPGKNPAKIFKVEVDVEEEEEKAEVVTELPPTK